MELFNNKSNIWPLILLILMLFQIPLTAGEVEIIDDTDSDDSVIGVVEEDGFISGDEESISGDDEDFIDEEEIFIEENDLIIEAEGLEVPGLGEPGQTTTINREELEASGARTVAEVLQRVPGVTVSRQGGGLESATISIRGSSSDQVLVLVDGERRNGLWGGAVNLNSLPLDRIESVEIIRGGGSALYGEGALGGILSLTTRKADSWAPDILITAGYGSFNTVSGSFSITGGMGETGQLSGRLFGEGIMTDGSYNYNSGQEETSRSNNQGWSGSFSGGLEWMSMDSLIRADFSFDGQFTRRGVPGLMEFLTPEASKKEESWGAALAVTLNPSFAGIFRMNAGGSKRLNSYINPDENLDESHDNLGGNLSFEWESPEVGSGLTVSGKAGIETGMDKLESTGLTDSTGTALNGGASQLSGSASGSLDLGIGPVSLIPAVRWDIFSQEYLGRESIDRNALSWSLTGQGVWEVVSVELSGQSSYHNPSFQDLFWPSGAFASGNPDLLPERGTGGDLGVTWDGFKNISIVAGGFYQRVFDLIQWLPSAGGVWRPRNVGEVEIFGAEASVRGIIPLMERAEGGLPWFLEYRGGYDWLRCRDNTENTVNFGRQLAYRPEHSASITLLLTTPDNSTIEVTGNYQGRRFTNNANTKSFDPVFLLDASARYFLTETWELSLSGRNLTNREYIDRLGYPVPGIEWTIEGGFHY